MILTNLNDCERYTCLHPLFQQAFEVIKTTDWSGVELGRVEIQGEELFVNNSSVEAVYKKNQVLEVHHKYIDIHVLLAGEETIGWLPSSDLKELHTAYDPQNDYALYTDAPATYFNLRPADMCLVFPEDAHAPIIGKGIIRKLIVKVRI